LTANEVSKTMITGALSVISCTAVNCEAPPITRIEKPMTSARLNPASVPATPNSRPNGMMTSKNGRLCRTPRQ